MDYNILNRPTRIGHGLVVAPWEFTLYNLLSIDGDEGHSIRVVDLIDAYEKTMTAYSLEPISRASITRLLIAINPSDRLVNNGLIGFKGFSKSLGWYVRMKKHYEQPRELSHSVVATLNKSYFNWHKYGLLVITTMVDLIVASLLTLTKLYLGGWLLLARASASIILTNILYILLPYVGISTILPDQVLANAFPAEYSHLYHKLSGIKIIIASIAHTVGHIGQIHYAINKCKKGCARESIHIVSPSDTQILISYSYFSRQYAYATGIVLLLLFTCMVCYMLLYRWHRIRYSTNQLMHRLCAVFGFIMVVAHGCSHLIGFNLSYILTLPLLIIYCWHRRREVIPVKVAVVRWVVTDSFIRLYLEDRRHLDNLLRSFNNVTIYTNHPSISKFEWHPFTLSRGNAQSNAILTMKRVGEWTNKLATILTNSMIPHQYVNIGHYTRSKFRFHRLYKERYFFCAGIGITAFMASMMDTLLSNLHQSTNTILVWSVSDLTIVKEFSEQINELRSKIQHIKVYIYYSNSSKSKGTVSDEVKTRFSYLQYIIYGHSKVDIITGIQSPVCIFLQRVDFIGILSRAVVTNRILRQQIGAFVCGPMSYADHVTGSIDLINRNGKVVFKTWTECV